MAPPGTAAAPGRPVVQNYDEPELGLASPLFVSFGYFERQQHWERKWEGF